MKKMTTLFLVQLICFAASAQQKDSTINAKMKLAEQYYKGQGQIYNTAKAFTLYKECAEAGDTDAMAKVGWQYYTGVGTIKNYGEALSWLQKAVAAGNTASANYTLALMYKNGAGVPMDYTKAYECFVKSAATDYPMALYGQGYMSYKGFGCTQDYTKAAELFRRSAAKGKLNGMYFLGLCLRNGYGVTKNIDSANYWLQKASRSGYMMATDELAATEPESNGIAIDLSNKIKNLQDAATKSNSNINKYVKVENKIKAASIEGEYEGYIIKYDWSGKQIVAVSKLLLALMYVKDTLKGQWIEDNSIAVRLKALVTPKALIFDDMQYSKKGHYNPVVGENLRFEKASLQFVKDKDATYLTGNIDMFNLDRQEPAKPLSVVLKHTSMISIDTNKVVDFTNEDGTPFTTKSLAAYPNPFSKFINVDFAIKESCTVLTQLLTLDGKVVYTNGAGTLQAGNYTLQLQPTQIASGTYILKLQCGKKIRTVKLVKI